LIRQHKPSTKEENMICMREENEFTKKNSNASDTELLEYVQYCAKQLGRTPKRHEVVGYVLLKQRFGAWNRVLEKAGLREVRKKKQK